MLWFSKHSQKKQDSTDKDNNSLNPIKIVISGANDGMSVNPNNVLINSLQQMPFLTFSSEKISVFENFSNTDHQNFFDFWEKGVQILRHHQADVLLRFDQDQKQIRLSFQTENMYRKNAVAFFSVANYLYLPIDFFEEDILPPQISALILATILAFNFEKNEKYKSYLEQIMDRLSQKKLPAGIDVCHMPYILIFLILDYLTLKRESFNKQDMMLVAGLIQSAQKNLSQIQDPMIEGIIYAVRGQIYLCASNCQKADMYTFVSRAIEYFKKSQKYFSRYAYPYDNGGTALVLADLYLRLFNLSDDNQALRDAISQLRSAEQIFTFLVNPVLWGDIKEKLGSCFSVLSSKSNSEEIALLSVNNYREEQKVYNQEKHPEKWADIEKEIADVYYHLGKHIQNEKYLEKSIDSYNKAFEVYESLNQISKTRLLEKCVLRADEEIMRLF